MDFLSPLKIYKSGKKERGRKMDILSLLMMLAIGLTLALIALAALLAGIMSKYGILYTQPQFVWVVLNLITGKMVEKFPGLSLIIPGIHKKIREVSCLPHVMGVKSIDAISSDGQRFSVSYQLTWWVDAFEDEAKEEKRETEKLEDQQIISLFFKGKFAELFKKITGKRKKFKEGRAIKAATRIADEKKAEESDEQAFERHATSNVDLETVATVTSILGGHETVVLKEQKKCKIYCPACNTEIAEESPRCSNINTQCRWSGDKINIPVDFKARLSWLATVILDKSLSDRFGIGCDIKISNIAPPKELQKALLDQKVFEIKKDIAQKQGEATMARSEKEAKGFDLLGAAGISPTTAFIVNKAAEVISEFSNAWINSSASKQSKQEQRGEDREKKEEEKKK